MKRLFNLLPILASLLLLGACEEQWRDIDYTYPSVEVPEEPEPTPEVEAKPRYVWIDLAANFSDYANSRENIARDLARIKEVGFTDIIVDVRGTDGDVFFNSSVAEPVTKVDTWHNGEYVWLERTENFDYLQAFIDEGHEVGLKVNASINTLVGGYLCPYGLGSNGMLYRDDSKKEWAMVINSADGLVNTMDITDDYGPRFLNPANDEVVEYLLTLLGDLAAYDLDGIVLDRCRYDDNGLMSDFSDISREKFEEHIGQTVENWPDDVFAPGTTELPRSATKHMFKWLEFRAKMIHDFVEKAADKVHAVNPDCRFGCYVGAWYSSYYESGVNWASPKFNTQAAYPQWASLKYKDYGYADHCDFMFLGCYASVASIYGSGEWTMQGFAEQGRELLMGDTLFAGGPDIGNPGDPETSWPNGKQGHKIGDAIDACITPSDGVFIFDLIHIKMYDYWDDVKSGIDRYLASLVPEETPEEEVTE